jgi:predicted ATPase
MQRVMAAFAQVTIEGVGTVALAIKVAVAAGPVRRIMVGDPAIQLIDVLAGDTVDRLAVAEHYAQSGEVVLDTQAVAELGDTISVAEWRTDSASNQRFAVLRELKIENEQLRSELISDTSHSQVSSLKSQFLKPWLLPPVYERLRRGAGDFLTELRPAVALFLRFGQIDYDRDPAAGAKLDSYIRWVQGILAHYGGFLHQLSTGDKGTYLYAAFGAPQAHEDDAKRAVAAALELRAPSFDFITSVQIGIAQGSMRTGAYGAARRRTYGVLGDEVNIAARLMQRAAHGQVLVSSRVRQAAANAFLWEELAPITVKGKSKPLIVFQLLGEQRTRTLNISGPQYSLPMIGRAAELSAIEQLLALAAQGSGQLAGITAEAGMGKSRLVFEILRVAQDQQMECYGGECQSYGTAVAYLVWRPIWYALFAIEPEASPAEKLAQLERALAAIGPDLAPQMPLLSGLLDLPIEDNDITRPIPSPARKQMLEQLLAQCLRSRAAARPLCLILEDCHWIDALSQELLAVVSAAIADLPMLIMLTYRPPEPADQSRLQTARLANFTEVRLSELSPANSSELVELKMVQLFADTDMPPAALVGRISEQAQGNPFYIEELMNYLRDHGVNPNDTHALANIELPATLQSLVLSRIDRLAENQQLTVKIASIVGRRFPVAWLWGVHPVLGDAHQVRQDLQLLQSIDLTALDTPDPELSYLFKHVITRDVAYESMPIETRQRLHEQLAGFLERSLPDALPLDLLAYHYAYSANRAKEAHYCALASELAVRNGAYQDAYNYVQRALAIVATLPDTSERVGQELGLQLSLGAILLVIRGQGALEAKAVYDRARELCRRLAPGPELGRALFGLWTYYLFHGLMGPAEELAEESLKLAQMANDANILIMAHLAVSQTALWSGKSIECLEHMRQVFAYHDPALHQLYITHYAQNPRYTAMSGGLWALWALGYADQALAMIQTGIAEAAALNHEFTYVIIFQSLPTLYCLQRRMDKLAETAGTFIAHARRAGNPFYLALGLKFDAWLKIHNGQFDEGLALLHEQRAATQAMGLKMFYPFLIALIAEGYLRAGRYDAGLALLHDEYDTMAANGQDLYLPELLRIRGELLLARDDGHALDAEGAFRQAMHMARAQHAKALELRAALSLSRMLERQGRHDEAYEMLFPVYDWFTEGLDAPDMLEAAALLHELRGVTTLNVG